MAIAPEFCPTLLVTTGVIRISSAGQQVRESQRLFVTNDLVQISVSHDGIFLFKMLAAPNNGLQPGLGFVHIKALDQIVIGAIKSLSLSLS